MRREVNPSPRMNRSCPSIGFIYGTSLRHRAKLGLGIGLSSERVRVNLDIWGADAGAGLAESGDDMISRWQGLAWAGLAQNTSRVSGVYTVTQPICALCVSFQTHYH